MKKQWHLFGIGFSFIFGTVFWQQTVSAPNEKLSSLSVKLAGKSEEVPAAKTPGKTTFKAAYKKQVALADSVIQLGLKRIGTPYRTAGISDAGFDCSGFVSFMFNKVGISVPHSSQLLSETGKFIARTEAQKGDIIIFTGTNVADRTPGHVGIVISQAGQPLTFVHSSSNGGVKISEVETTNYEKRFLEIRRVL